MSIPASLSLMTPNGRGWVSSGTDETEFGTFPVYRLNNFETSIPMDEVKEIIDGVIANLKRSQILPPDYVADHYTIRTNRGSTEIPVPFPRQTLASFLGYSDNIQFLWFVIHINPRGGKRRKSRKTKKGRRKFI